MYPCCKCYQECFTSHHHLPQVHNPSMLSLINHLKDLIILYFNLHSWFCLTDADWRWERCALRIYQDWVNAYLFSTHLCSKPDTFFSLPLQIFSYFIFLSSTRHVGWESNMEEYPLWNIYREHSEGGCGILNRKGRDEGSVRRRKVYLWLVNWGRAGDLTCI